MKIEWLKQLDLKTVEGIIITLSKDQQNTSTLSLPLETLRDKELFAGKSGESYQLSLLNEGHLMEIALVGLGESHEFCPSKFRTALAEAFKGLQGKKVQTLGIDLTSVKEMDAKQSRALAETLVMSTYAFNTYKSDAPKTGIESVFITGCSYDENGFEEGKIHAEANLFARMLTNTPANIMTPAYLADMAKSYGEAAGLEVEIKEEKAIRDMGMHAFLAVAQASSNAPKLIVMRHKGAPNSEEQMVYVGKGLTYDSGGLSIKPTASMLTMKDDMSGASAVIAAMGAISKLQIKANVTAVVAACENMISGLSYKPGDIISSMGGKSIFIGNTDAEGRLTLVDAVTYAIEYEKATHILDIATLTGAAVSCLGSEAAPVITNNDDFYHLVEKSFEKADEKIWRMPVYEAYKKMLKHEQADLTNSAGMPGMMTAGLFIGEFVKDLPWVHVDIAGTAYTEKAKGPYSAGGTGSGTIPLIYLAKKWSKLQ